MRREDGKWGPVRRSFCAGVAIIFGSFACGESPAGTPLSAGSDAGTNDSAECQPQVLSDGSNLFHSAIATDRASMAVDTTIGAGNAAQVTKTVTFRIDGTLLMEIDSTIPNAGPTHSHILYGPAVHGVRQGDFTVDGKTIEGSFDGRAIVPMPVEADKRTMRFADGQPPPRVDVDASVIAAFQDLLNKAGAAPQSECPAAGSTGEMHVLDQSVPGQAGQHEQPGISVACFGCESACVGVV